MYLGLFLDSVPCICLPVYSGATFVHYHIKPRHPSGAGKAKTRSPSLRSFLSHNWVAS